MAAALPFVQTRRSWVPRALYEAPPFLRMLFSRTVMHRGRLDDVEVIPSQTAGRSLVRLTIVFEAASDAAERYVAAKKGQRHVVEIPALARGRA